MSARAETGGVAYEILRRRGQKHIYLRIRPDGSVVVSTPRHVPDGEIAAFVATKASWIRSRLSHRTAHSRPEPSGWKAGTALWYLGESYPVRRIDAARNRLTFEGDGFLFHCCDEAGFLQAVRRFYHREAARHIGERVAYWSDRMGLVPADVAFRRYKSRWGCCNANNRLTFNTALIRYAPELIDYVIVHELAHIRHKNHSKAFWHLVTRYLPDAKALRRRLV